MIRSLLLLPAALAARHCEDQLDGFGTRVKVDVDFVLAWPCRAERSEAAISTLDVSAGTADTPS